MVTQVVAISMLLVSANFTSLRSAAIWWLWGVVLFSIVSLVDYFRKFWRKVDDSVKLRRRRELLLMEKKAQIERSRQRRAARRLRRQLSPWRSRSRRPVSDPSREES